MPIYIEPIDWRIIEQIIATERPDALSADHGRADCAELCALDLAREGVLEKYGVEMIGASRSKPSTWPKTGNSSAKAMLEIGLEHPGVAAIAHSMEEALQSAGQYRPSRPSSGLHSRWAGRAAASPITGKNSRQIVSRGLELSPTTEVLLEESVLGWKEFEMEVVRDHQDNCIIICSIENFDPMGVHTGDSITVAPAQTLTDKEYQRLRDASIAVLRKIGVDTGRPMYSSGSTRKMAGSSSSR